MNRLRIILALGGFVLALLSVAYDERVLAWVAIGLLTLSLGLRLWLRKRDRSEPGSGDSCDANHR
jgi:uncharacterized membrane protein YfcA